MSGCSDDTHRHDCCFDVRLHIPSSVTSCFMCHVGPSSAERKLMFEIEACSGAGVELRP